MVSSTNFGLSSGLARLGFGPWALRGLWTLRLGLGHVWAVEEAKTSGLLQPEPSSRLRRSQG